MSRFKRWLRITLLLAVGNATWHIHWLVFLAYATSVIYVCLSSVGEWSIHNWALHMEWWFLKFPYRAHHTIHHPRFSGPMYRLEARPKEQRKHDKDLIPMAKWAFAVIIPIGWAPSLLTALLLAFVWSWWAEAIVIGGIGLFIATVYFLTYEAIHMYMHDRLGVEEGPDHLGDIARWLRRKWALPRRIIDWLDRHHDGHHDNVKKNLNVVFPFADWLFGTLDKSVHTRT